MDEHEEQYTLTYYTHRAEAYYTIGPFASADDALAYANRAHNQIPGGVGNVSITTLNSPTLDPNEIYGRETAYFDDAAVDGEYHFLDA